MRGSVVGFQGGQWTRCENRERIPCKRGRGYAAGKVLVRRNDRPSRAARQSRPALAYHRPAGCAVTRHFPHALQALSEMRDTSPVRDTFPMRDSCQVRDPSLVHYPMSEAGTIQ